MIFQSDEEKQKYIEQRKALDLIAAYKVNCFRIWWFKDADGYNNALAPKQTPLTEETFQFLKRVIYEGMD